MKLIDLLRTLIAAPFIAVAWVFYKLYEFIDPYVEWELDRYPDYLELDFDDVWDSCCDEDCD